MVLINLPFMGQYIASRIISPVIKRESPSLMMINNSQFINHYYFSLKGCTVRWLERTNMKKVLVFQMERYYLLTQSAKPYLTCDLIDISWFDNLKSFWTGCFLKCISAPRQFKTPKRKLGGIFKVQCFPFHYAFIGLWSHGSPEAWYQHSKVFVLTAL